MKIKRKTSIILSMLTFLFLINSISVLGTTGHGHIDTFANISGTAFMFCHHDDLTLYDPEFELFLDVQSSAGNKSVGVFGVFYFSNEDNSTIYTFTIKVWNNTDVPFKYNHTYSDIGDDHFFTINCYAEIGVVNSFSIDFTEWAKLNVSETDRLYTYHTQNVNHPDMLNAFYNNYLGDGNCLLDGYPKSKTQYDEYHESHSAFAVLYNTLGHATIETMLWDMKAVAKNEDCNDEVEDLTVFLSLSIILGVSIGGITLYKYRKYSSTRS